MTCCARSSAEQSKLPRISFILPARNAASTIAAAIDSLLAQTYPDHEVLVYDDGSTDDTADIVSRRAAGDRRVRLVGQQRVGLVGALQRLVASSDAELLSRMDADDLSAPVRLAEQVAALADRPELGGVSCLVRCFPDATTGDGIRRYVRWLNSLITPEQIGRDIFVESPLCHPSITMRREAYERVGGYTDDGRPEDYGLWLRFHADGIPLAKVPRVLFDWRDGPERLTRTDPRYAAERFTELKLAHLLAGPLADVERVGIWGAGRTGRLWGRRLTAAGRTVEYFVDVAHKKIGRTLAGAPIIAPDDLDRSTAQMLVVAVAATGVRALIREHLDEREWTEPESYVCVA